MQIGDNVLQKINGLKHQTTVNHDVAGSASHRSPSCVVLRQLDTLASTLLALLATPLDKTIFNRFICINTARGAKKKGLAIAGPFFNEINPCEICEMHFVREILFCNVNVCGREWIYFISLDALVSNFTIHEVNYLIFATWQIFH